MTVILFPPPKDDLLAFDGMGIKIDVEQQRECFNALFTITQTALRFCNLDYVEAGKMARKFIDADVLDETGSHWAETVECLERYVAMMKAALIRLEVSEDRALGRKRRIK